MVVLAGCVLTSSTMQGQWAVAVTPTMDPLPAGFCAAVHLTIFDSVARDIPRNPLGHRVTIAEFDMTVSSASGNTAVGQWIDASHWNACACQGASGGVATVTASYPAKSLAARARVQGVSLQRSASFTVAPPKGPVNPVGCAAVGIASGGGSAAAGGGAAVGGPGGAAGQAAAPAGGGVAPGGAATGTAVGTASSGNAAGGAAGAGAGVGGPAGAAGQAAATGSATTGTAVGAASGNAAGGGAAGAGIGGPAGAAGQAAAPGGATTGTAAGTAASGNVGGGAAAGGGAAGAARAGAGAAGAPQAGGAASGGGAVGGAAIGIVAGTGGRTGRAPSGGAAAGAIAVVPVNPSGFVAVQTAPGQVQLSWQPVNGVAFYGLFGPGVASGGQQVMAGTTTFQATGVPAGAQQWSVGSYYPGQVTTGFGAFPTVALNVTAPAPTPPPVIAAGAPAKSNNYLVTVVALRPYQASVDDFLSRDGMGDEVYAAAFVRRYNRKTGQLLDYASKQTAAYGDVSKFGGQRVQAGSASGTGGIRDGDPIPAGPVTAVRTIPAQDILFPWRLWEGALTDSAEALIITPSIWEQDGGTAFYDQWVQQQAALNLSLFANATIQDQITKNAFGAVVSGNSGNGSGNTLGYQLRTALDMTLIQFGFPIVTLLQTTNDRPIGLLANGVDATMLPVQAVVLTREIIEAALAQPAKGFIMSPVPLSPWSLATVPVPAPKPGVLVLHFRDDRMPLQGVMLSTERPAIYEMFIQVERMP